MNSSASVIILCLVCSQLFPLIFAAEEQGSLEKLENAYQEMLAKAEAPVFGFQQRYEEELKKLAVEAQKAGKLDEMLAIKKEISDFRERPPSNLNPFPDVANLRRIYDANLVKLRTEAAKESNSALQKYIGAVSEIVSELTSSGDIDGAVQVNALKQSLIAQLASRQPGTIQPQPLSPAQSPPNTVFVGDVDTIPGLQGKSGRLRSFGKFTIGEEILPPEAADIDDFVKVYAYDRSWVGLRENGSVFIKYIRPNVLTVHTSEVRSIEKISRGHDGWIVDRGDQFWRVADPVKALDLVDTPAGILGCHCAGLAYQSDGSFVTTGATFGPGKRVPPPEDFFEGIIGAGSGANTMIAIDPGGTLRGWETDPGQETTFEGITGVMEFEAGRDHAVIRRADGTIQTFSISSRISGWDPSMDVPSDLGGIVARIRAGGNASAIQRTDGTWLSWGPNTDLNNAVRAAGVAIDLDLFGSGSGGYAIWIEPVE